MNFLPVPHEVMNWKNNGLVHAFIIFSNKKQSFQGSLCALNIRSVDSFFFRDENNYAAFLNYLDPFRSEQFSFEKFSMNSSSSLLLFLLAFNVSQDSRIIITEKYKVWKWLFSKPKNNRKTIILHVTTQACQIGRCRRTQNLPAQKSWFYSVTFHRYHRLNDSMFIHLSLFLNIIILYCLVI